MSEAISSPTGKFVWYEYIGDDLDGAAEFYGHVVGWSVKDSGMGDFRYLIANAGDYGVAGLMTIPAEARAMGAPACWTGYIWVPDVDAAGAKLEAAGGKVWRPASDIVGVGRFAVVSDPQGATFILFRDTGGNPPPRPAFGTPGLVGWHELMAEDGQRALAFYQEFFGWKKDGEFDMGPMGIYYLFSTGHGESGGLMTRPPQVPGVFWRYYFNVEAIDAAAARVVAKGGKIVNGPHEVPGGSFIVHAVDPQGAFFALTSGKR
jgi:predicted enzyme related to lactoylglutathione lyase